VSVSESVLSFYLAGTNKSVLAGTLSRGQDVVSCAYLELREEEDGWDACREVRSETKPIDFLLFFRVKSDS
jgi:hypothetical protein